jgi:hypothetical protein
MRFHTFCPLSQTRLFQNSWGFGVGCEDVIQRHACESEFGRRVLMGNMLRRGESIWLCMKFELIS